jgi:hypothetical protein
VDADTRNENRLKRSEQEVHRDEWPEAERTLDHLRPVARRLPFSGRAPGCKAQCRALAREGVLFRNTMPAQHLFSGQSLPLHRPLSDEQPRLPKWDAARRAPRRIALATPRRL